ncbi:unnamed protein product [Gadus morhua 'NCC']
MNPEPFRGPLQLSGNHAGQCGCEDGYTEVMTSDGVLDQCTVIPVLEIPTAGDSKTDVKTIRAPLDPTLSAGHAPGRAGRTWFLQPFGQDGKLKTWVYGVAAGVFVLLVFIVSMTYLACSRPLEAAAAGPASPRSSTDEMYWVQRDSLAVTYTCPDCQSRLEQDPQDQRGPPGPDPPQGTGRRPSSAHTHPSQPPPPQQSVSGQTPQLRTAHSFPSRPTSVSISSSTLPRVETLIT